MNQTKHELVSYFENISLFIVCALLFVFPLIFLSTTTDAFVLPKQLALAIETALFILLFGLRMIADGRLKIRTSPFDLPVTLFVAVALLSAVFSVNRIDAFSGFVPLLFVLFLYFGIINIVKTGKHLMLILSALTAGAVAASLLAILSFFKIYPLPFAYTHVPYFTTFGSLLDQALYLAILLPIPGFFVFSIMQGNQPQQTPFTSAPHAARQKPNGMLIGFSAAFAVMTVALVLTVYLLLTSQKPLILPLEFGLQTAFASISQDVGNVLKSFLLGSGFGTYLVDFTRFKAANYNLNSALWSFTFFRSSSFVLEILATMGLLGLLSYGFLIFKVIREKNFFLPVLLALAASLLLPFSFTLITLLFILLAVFAVVRINSNPDKYGEIDFYLVKLKRGLLAAAPEGEHVQQNANERKLSKLLPLAFFVVILMIAAAPLYFATLFFLSDFTFQKSLVAASQNNGLQTYNLQISAIKMFPYRDMYYRAFSQTNLALANALALTQQSGSEPNQQVQQNILTLIQQAITSGRSAASIAPYTAFNWNNLSSIYRSLIGFGQNADQFTIITSQQAIALDPNNPQQYLDLGGIYYQIGQYDEAIRQFQVAINMKQDYANAYYNLGHALEAKGDLQSALAAYQQVKLLVAADAENVKKIDTEIAALQEKIANPQPAPVPADTTPTPTPGGDKDADLNVNRPSAQLPERKPPVEIPAPTISSKITPTKAPAAKTSVTPAPTRAN